MIARTFPDAESFLRDTQRQLESNEAANSLMLGVCLRMMRYVEWIRTLPCLKAVNDETGLVLAAMMTPPHNLVVYGHQGDLDEGARVLVADLLSEGWAVPGVLGPREAARHVAEKWAESTGKRFQLQGRQGVHELRQVGYQAPERGRLRAARLDDVELTTTWRHAFHLDIFGETDREENRRAVERSIQAGDLFLWDDIGPVSMAMKTRPTRNGISISLVYTPPEWRSRGYATACVGELSRRLLDSGRKYCALFVDVTNIAAIKVYHKVGYEPICDYAEYSFLDRD
jgi:predicted GNAT family acetyltransferase